MIVGTTFKPFTTTLIGSLPRSQKLLALKEKAYTDEKSAVEYEKLLLEETKEVVELQERVGIDIVVSGELSRDNYMSYVAEHVPGIKLMSTEEILEITCDEESFEESLKKMDADDGSMNNPVCYDRIDTEATLDVEEIKTLMNLTDSAIKATLPSPYLLARSLWVEEVTGDVYEDREELGQDVVTLLINEINRLADLDVDVIQIDDPILSEVCFTSASEESNELSFY